MNPVLVALLLLGSLSLAGCKRAPAGADAAAKSVGAVPQADGQPGRFVGVGIYSPGSAWSRMADADDPKAAPTRPKAGDDQAVIVVQDTKTGELRACGDMTGYCIGMNPWNKALTLAQIAPINLTPLPPPPPPPGRHHHRPAAAAAAPKPPLAPQTPAGTPAAS